MSASGPSLPWRDGCAIAELPRVGVPLPARVYDYLLGGKDNYAVDREAGDLLCARVPAAMELAWANRRFLHRVVKFMARRGIIQFVDIGPGFPTAATTGEVARRINPGTRVLYADNDPVVVSHLRALQGDDLIMALHADVREPEEILLSLQAEELIDFTRPVGLLLTGILHFIPDDCDLREVMAALRRRLAPGSYVAVSHLCSTGTLPEWREAVQGSFPAGSPARPVFRTAGQIRQLFGDWPLVQPGLVEVANWRPDNIPPVTPAPVMSLGGVAMARLVA
jgi:S-adenosyl methyltransferase